MGYLKKHKVKNPKSKVLVRSAEHWEAAYTRLSRWRRHRLRRLSEAQGHRCCYCCRETFIALEVPKGMVKNQRATLEHFVPYHLPQQTNKDENHLMACSLCNGLRATKDPYKFYKDLLEGNVEAITPKKAMTKVRRRARKEERIQERLEDEPEKVLEKQRRAFVMAWIIVSVWPEHVDAISEMCDRRESKSHSKAHFTVNKIKSHLDQIPRHRMAA